MVSTTQGTVRDVLREYGPLSLDRLLGQVLARQSLVTKDSRQTVRNALTNDPLCERTLEGAYVYLPSFVQGACVRLGLERAAPHKELVAVDADAFELLWVGSRAGESGPPPTLALEDGPRVTAQAPIGRGLGTLHSVLRLPQPFWSW